MLKAARRRIAERGWKNVEAVEADAIQFRPAEELADVVTFSYSLTMIPDWFAAIENAWSILKPGGVIGVRGLLRLPEASGRRISPARFLRTQLLADVLQPQRRVSLARSSALLASPFHENPLQRIAGADAHTCCRLRAVLHLHRKESGGIAGVG